MAEWHAQLWVSVCSAAMTFKNRKSATFGSLMLFTCVALLPTSYGRAQTQDQSPSDLIRFLTYQSDRPDKWGVVRGIFSCGAANGEAREDRAVARSLVRLGVLAIPDIEEALDSIERLGQQSKFATNSGWLLFAYARIEGSAAYPRLRRMIGKPELAFLQNGLDNSLALSLGLTSYVSASQVPMRISRCRRDEPRDALDQLILAWERNDRPWLEAILGPSARAALNTLLKGRTWEGMRAELWHGDSSADVAVGYRFEVPGPWSEPEETLDDRAEHENATMSLANPDLDTLFTDGAGGDCGRHRVKFLKTQVDGSAAVTYLVDNSDLGDLLRSIASCATKTSKRP